MRPDGRTEIQALVDEAREATGRAQTARDHANTVRAARRGRWHAKIDLENMMADERQVQDVRGEVDELFPSGMPTLEAAFDLIDRHRQATAEWLTLCYESRTANEMATRAEAAAKAAVATAEGAWLNFEHRAEENARLAAMQRDRQDYENREKLRESVVERERERVLEKLAERLRGGR